jgi:putative Holliday junction resolvase
MEMADNAACARMEAIRKWPISENAIITTAAADFRIALPHGGRLIGMDVGTRTIGLALCDAGWMIASAAHTIARGKFSKDKVQLAAFMGEQQVKGIVIGLPLNLDGTDSPRTQASRAFARNMADLGLPILFMGTSAGRRRPSPALMIEADTSRARRSELVDKLAASYILQGAIDALTL